MKLGEIFYRVNQKAMMLFMPAWFAHYCEGLAIQAGHPMNWGTSNHTLVA